MRTKGFPDGTLYGAGEEDEVCGRGDMIILFDVEGLLIYLNPDGNDCQYYK